MGAESRRYRDNRGYECSRRPELFDRCGFRPLRHSPASVDGHEHSIAFSQCIEGSVQHDNFCRKARDNQRLPPIGGEYFTSGRVGERTRGGTQEPGRGSCALLQFS
jgi:hypothetical protein